MENLIRGAVAMGFFIISIFFFRFWKESRDRLFGFFAFSFIVLAVNRFLIGITESGSEASHYLYVVRLIAFVIIIYAIVDKNLKAKRS